MTNIPQTSVASDNDCVFLSHITCTSWGSCGFSRYVFFILGPKLEDQLLPGHTILMAEGKRAKDLTETLESLKLLPSIGQLNFYSEFTGPSQSHEAPGLTSGREEEYHSH